MQNDRWARSITEDTWSFEIPHSRRGMLGKASVLFSPTTSDRHLHQDDRHHRPAARSGRKPIAPRRPCFAPRRLQNGNGYLGRPARLTTSAAASEKRGPFFPFRALLFALVLSKGNQLNRSLSLGTLRRLCSCDQFEYPKIPLAETRQRNPRSRL